MISPLASKGCTISMSLQSFDTTGTLVGDADSAVFTLMLSDGSSSPEIYTLFTFTSDTSKAGAYNLAFEGNIVNYETTVDVNFIATIIDCETSVITASSFADIS